MKYAYKFDCYNELKEPKLSDYDRQVDRVRVWVAAVNIDLAIEAARNLVNRDEYELDEIRELAEDGHAIVAD